MTSLDLPTPGLSFSPGLTPASESPEMFVNVSSSMPSGHHTEGALNSDGLPQESMAQLTVDQAPLTVGDIRQDPILSSLARQQARQSISAPPTGTDFRARPAPSNMKAEGMGPRMTKAAALRQGIKWEGGGGNARPVTSGSVMEGRERKEVDFQHVPGHKRRGLNIAVASLADPMVAPRQTKASLLRTGGTMEKEEKRDFAAAALANKAKDKEEYIKRRASVALPASLAAPTIVPRANRSSQLRTGGPQSPPSAYTNALRSSTSNNVGAPSSMSDERSSVDEKAKRRASVIGTVKSLGAPTIQPRANRSSLLRAPGSATVVPQTSTTTSSSSRPSLGSAWPQTAQSSAVAMKAPPPVFGSRSARPSSSAGRVSESQVGPRPTKSSLLRAGLSAAKIPTKP